VIETACPNCRTLYRLLEQHAGMKARCRQCNTVFTVVPLARAGPVIVDRQPMWMRPVSAIIGRLSAPSYAIIMGSVAFFKPGPTRVDAEVRDVVDGFCAANTDDVLEVQLGSSMPLRNLRRIWRRRGLSVIGKVIGTVFWPLWECHKAVMRSDSYDPYAHSVALYHKDRAIIAHELGHAQDYARREWRVLYALSRILPIIGILVVLYQEWLASNYGIQNLQSRGLNHAIRRANRELGGGFGSYFGVLFLGIGAVPGGLLGQIFGYVVMPFGKSF